MALILGQIVARAVRSYNLRSDRILSIRLPGKPITIIQVHVPITEAEEHETESFYASIQEEIDHTPKQDMVIKIIGDWNAKVRNKVESTVIGKFGLGVTNKAGDQLVDFCEANNLFHHEHLLQTAKEMAVHMDITRWPIQKSSRLCDWKQEMEKLDSPCQDKNRSRLWF